ncbi:DUF418 domain-containing protein [Virgibacillus xinjiangensis]|uniref:DUF418 domain-containing protein n=1 Tax=Virgibacillus xinjiangensis TaxID=393090 RepID=A0ABV7CWQ0_9BACI
MDLQPQPVKDANRLEWLDAARGFAIFGIFIVNIGTFSAPYFIYGGQWEAWPSSIDQWTLRMIDIFFQASFYTMFSILFGFGFQLMNERLQEKGIRVKPFLARRLLILIGFGLVHAFLIWHGDILLSYGSIGLLMLLFLRVKEKTLLLWAMALLLGSAALFTLGLYAARDYLDQTFESEIQQAFDNYQSGSLTDIWGQNLRDWMFSNAGSFLILICMLLPMFLIGMYLARKRIFHKPEESKASLMKIWGIMLLLFMVLKAGPYIFGNPTWFSYIQDNIGGTASALFYIATFALAAQTKVGRLVIRPFSLVGRMALSNYIFQSVVSVVIFYGIGLGLYGSVSPSSTVLIAAGIFIIQIMLSRWWMAQFRFGPLEWIWRSLTYNKRQPFRRKNGKEA